MTAKYTTKMVEFQFASWENTNNATTAFHELQKEYPFIFRDKQVMAFPIVKAQIEKIYKDDLKRQMAMISFSIQVGNMRPEIVPAVGMRKRRIGSKITKIQ